MGCWVCKAIILVHSNGSCGHCLQPYFHRVEKGCGLTIPWADFQLILLFSALSGLKISSSIPSAASQLSEPLTFFSAHLLESYLIQ